MLHAPKAPEIDHRTAKLLVGIIALNLATLTRLFANSPLESISEAYYKGGPSQIIFIGCLFAVAAFLAAYNGRNKREMIASKIAAFAALGVALFPCGCDGQFKTFPGVFYIPGIHWISAAVLFSILAYFCRRFYVRALGKGHTEAKRRARIYVVCGLAILTSIVMIAIDSLTSGAVSRVINGLTFYGEMTALVAFGISWLTASQTAPYFTAKDERFNPFSAKTTPERKVA